MTQPAHATHTLRSRTLRPRRGFSLLEVLLASAILLGAVIVLGELAHLGIRNAAAARDLTTAELICRSTMNEIVAGISPAEEIENAVVMSTPGWVYSVEFVPLEHPGVTAIRVTVAEDIPEERDPLTFSLVRWVPASLDSNASSSFGTDFSSSSFGGDSYVGNSTTGQGPSRGGR
jgi:prepilin-type N-terminal cleavage/methylation domain-containing protein